MRSTEASAGWCTILAGVDFEAVDRDSCLRTILGVDKIGPTGDTFEVYRGRMEYPLDNAPVWRYLAKDGLRSPDVPAVEAFRKLIEEAEKQQKGP